MKYAIIAAGEGSRLAEEGVREHKPMVTVNGEKLIDRLIRLFADNGAESIAVAYRRGMPDVAARLAGIRQDGIGGRRVNIEAVEACTPSSMHSMYAISQLLTDGPFCLTTVDTVFGEEAFRRYADTLKACMTDGTADGMMAVTDYIDDEKPLYVATDDEMNITAFTDEPCGSKYVSAGVYGLKPQAVDVLRRCMERGESRMRNFQRALLREGMRLKAFDIGKAFDIDHADDIIKAERFLSINA